MRTFTSSIPRWPFQIVGHDLDDNRWWEVNCLDDIEAAVDHAARAFVTYVQLNPEGSHRVEIWCDHDLIWDIEGRPGKVA